MVMPIDTSYDYINALQSGLSKSEADEGQKMNARLGVPLGSADVLLSLGMEASDISDKLKAARAKTKSDGVFPPDSANYRDTSKYLSDIDKYFTRRDRPEMTEATNAITSPDINIEGQAREFNAPTVPTLDDRITGNVRSPVQAQLPSEDRFDTLMMEIEKPLSDDEIDEVIAGREPSSETDYPFLSNQKATGALLDQLGRVSEGESYRDRYGDTFSGATGRDVLNAKLANVEQGRRMEQTGRGFESDAVNRSGMSARERLERGLTKERLGYDLDKFATNQMRMDQRQSIEDRLSNARLNQQEEQLAQGRDKINLDRASMLSRMNREPKQKSSDELKSILNNPEAYNLTADEKNAIIKTIIDRAMQ